jgi:hypothetical protein
MVLNFTTSATTKLTTSSCDVHFKILSGILGYLRGRLASLQPAGKSGCLYNSFDQDHDSVFFSFLSIKPTMLSTSMLKEYSTRASLMPSCFLRCTNLLETYFSSRHYSTYFLFALFLDLHTDYHARHNARILLYECVLDAI